MYLCDYHTHTRRSPDASSSAAEMARAASEKGLKEIVITDHFDVAEAPIPEYADFVFDLDGLIEDVKIAKEEQAGRCKVKLGIELGQGSHIPKMAKELLESAEFDFVLGSLHNCFRRTDYYFVDYEHCDPKALVSEYTEGLYELACNADFDVASHLTYPLRYLMKVFPNFDLRPHYAEFGQVLKMLISRGKGIEINTTTLRKGYDFTMPPNGLIRLYKELHGEIITVGSDAHAPCEVGCDIAKTRELLAEFGFKYLAIFEKRRADFIKML